MDDPGRGSAAAIVSEISEITPDIEKSALGVGSSFGKGGMSTKISAARTCMEHGIDTVIINGRNPKNICRVLNGVEIGTVFLSGVK
jgi:glutamate 5-kinase